MKEEHVPAGEAPEGTRPAEAEEILRRRKYIVIPVFVLVFLAVLY